MTDAEFVTLTTRFETVRNQIEAILRENNLQIRSDGSTDVYLVDKDVGYTGYHLYVA